MSKGKRIRNGDIVAIPLIEGMGFGYAKILDPKIVWGEDMNVPTVLRIYDFQSQELVDRIEDMDKRLLIAPVAVVGINGAIRSGWHKIGNEKINKEDEFVPHVKSKWPSVDPQAKDWVYMEEFGNTMKMHKSTYDKVKHLESNSMWNIDAIPFRIVMEFYKKNGVDIKSRVKLNWLEEEFYNQSYQLPMYNSLPEELKGRAIL